MTKKFIRMDIETIASHAVEMDEAKKLLAKQGSVIDTQDDVITGQESRLDMQRSVIEKQDKVIAGLQNRVVSLLATVKRYGELHARIPNKQETG